MRRAALTGPSRTPSTRTSRPSGTTMRATTALLASSPRWANGPLMARKIIQRPGANSWQIQGNCLTCAYEVERVTRIELALSAWEADVLPLNYTRTDEREPRDTPGLGGSSRHRTGVRAP